MNKIKFIIILFVVIIARNSVNALDNADTAFANLYFGYFFPSDYKNPASSFLVKYDGRAYYISRKFENFTLDEKSDTGIFENVKFGLSTDTVLNDLIDEINDELNYLVENVANGRSLINSDDIYSKTLLFFSKKDVCLTISMLSNDFSTNHMPADFRKLIYLSGKLVNKAAEYYRSSK